MALTFRCWGSAQTAAVSSRPKEACSGEVDLSTWPDVLSLHSGDSGGQRSSQEWQLLLEKSSKDRHPRASPGGLSGDPQPPPWQVFPEWHFLGARKSGDRVTRGLLPPCVLSPSLRPHVMLRTHT